MITRLVHETYVESRELVHPEDLNVYGTLFGGRLVSLVDKIAGICAFQHSRLSVVTISIDSLTFMHAAKQGSIITLKAAVNRVFNTSMEVGVRVTAMEPNSDEEKLVCPAYLTFVALNEKGEKVAIPQVVPKSEEDKRRYENAGLRRETRLKLAEKLK